MRILNFLFGKKPAPTSEQPGQELASSLLQALGNESRIREDAAEQCARINADMAAALDKNARSHAPAFSWLKQIKDAENVKDKSVEELSDNLKAMRRVADATQMKKPANIYYDFELHWIRLWQKDRKAAGRLLPEIFPSDSRNSPLTQKFVGRMLEAEARMGRTDSDTANHAMLAPRLLQHMHNLMPDDHVVSGMLGRYIDTLAGRDPAKAVSRAASMLSADAGQPADKPLVEHIRQTADHVTTTDAPAAGLVSSTMKAFNTLIQRAPQMLALKDATVWSRLHSQLATATDPQSAGISAIELERSTTLPRAFARAVTGALNNCINLLNENGDEAGAKTLDALSSYQPQRVPPPSAAKKPEQPQPASLLRRILPRRAPALAS